MTILDDDPKLRRMLHELYMRLHRNPELSMQEHATAAVIEERMRALGYDVFRCGGTGVVAILTNGNGPVVGFRADIDGLPVQEATGLTYASDAWGRLPGGEKVPVMHACGHDTHITAAIGAATLLSGDKESWAGTIVFLFQPGEETCEGAAAMLEDGLWDRAPRPQVIYAQHVWPSVAGRIEISRGPVMSCSDAWRVTVKGRGGHGSRPQDTIDPVVLAAHMVIRIQSLMSREVAAQEAAVITIATIRAGLKENIIPSTAEFTVNTRTLNAETREYLLGALRRVLEAEALASNASEPEIEELYTFPLLINDKNEAEHVTGVLRGALGADKVLQKPAVMGSEDFGAFPAALGVPSVYWFFGGMPREVVDSGEPTPTNHSPFFGPVMEPTISTGTTAAYEVLMSRLRIG